MMDRIRDKMNKFSTLTYTPTKSWLSQLLDSGETGFLTDFITLVFEKAASEPSFCSLYAKLITELRGDFPHLDTELTRIFTEFLTVFDLVETETEVDPAAAAEYAAFVAMRERRRFRRGYALFIGEAGRLGSLTLENVARTADRVLAGVLATKVLEGQSLLTEEFADCLTTLVKSMHGLVTPAFVARVRAAMDRAGSPSLSNKARFALMDITEMS